MENEGSEKDEMGNIKGYQKEGREEGGIAEGKKEEEGR